MDQGIVQRKSLSIRQTGAAASVTDPDSWVSFAAAKQVVGNYDGIGYVLDDEMMVDLDNCRDPNNGNIDKWAEGIIRQLNSYTEVSPSGTGIRILLRTPAFTGTKHRATPTGVQARPNAHIELYWKGRYTTLTGHVVNDRSTVETRDTELASFYAEWFDKPKTPDLNTTQLPNHPDDAEIIRRASLNPKFKDLIVGDCSAYHSHSEADLALCSVLARFTQNPDQIDRIFRRSGLYRAKWDESHDSEGSTYGEMTIRRALESQDHADTSVRNSKRRQVSPPTKPLDNSRILVAALFTINGSRTLHYYRGNFYRWTGSHYEILEVEELEHKVLDFLSNAFYRTVVGTKGEFEADFDPTPPKMRAIVETLKAAIHVDSTKEVPFWIESEQTITENSTILAFANGLLPLDPDGNPLDFMRSTPKFFNTWSIPCEYRPSDAPPQPKLWLRFLTDLLG